ncbi:MAG TPA: diacylglycerol kinase family protein [Terriglobales bacterium]|nr:diacylglycerol kinase family protein [Terriglobales bacterium]
MSVIFGPGFGEKDLEAFKKVPVVSWQSGVPIKKEDADVVIVVGGDGTIHRHLPQLLELQLPVLIVPRGSGNDFARALNLDDVKHSLAAWQKFLSGAGNVRLIDVGVIKSPASNDSVQEHFFCTVAGVGIDGEVARRANGLPRWLRGNGGYVFTLLPTIFQFAPFLMKITLDGTTGPSREFGFRPTVLAAFANVPSFGGGMKIAPQAQFDDGQLDVCVIRDIDKFKLFCVFPTVYFGRHLALKEVEYSKAASIRVETEHPFDIYADGEYVCQTPVEVSLRQNALPVIVPWVRT